jgi:PEP-CTERM motif
MFSTLRFCLFQRSFSTRLLQTIALSLALMTASAAGVRAEDVTVQGAGGATGANGVNPGDDGEAGGAAGQATANASSGSANTATALGGSGGRGGNGTGYFYSYETNSFVGDGDGGVGGTGGAATAKAVTATISSLAGADATSIGGAGGNGGSAFSILGNGGFEDGSNGDGAFGDGLAGYGGTGGAATATARATTIFGLASAEAASTGGSGGEGGLYTGDDDGSGGLGGTARADAAAGSATGKATARATATGGMGGGSGEIGGVGGRANASSTARTNGPGDAVSSANAAGGDGTLGGNGPGLGGDATAMAKASAAGGGKATATAVAAAGGLGFPFPSYNSGVANATSRAETVSGTMAQALSTAVQGIPCCEPAGGQVTSTAKTTLEGVSVQTTVIVPLSDSAFGNATVTTDAIAQGGPSAVFAAPEAGTYFSVATVLPDKAFTTTLIDSFGATNVADALLGPQVTIFGALFANTATTTTFDFSFQGDLLLGDLDDDTVIDLGSNLGPNVELPIDGDFVIGGVVEAVPEPSTWAMMLIGFAGLGFIGYRPAGGRCLS